MQPLTPGVCAQEGSTCLTWKFFSSACTAFQLDVLLWTPQGAMVRCMEELYSTALAPGERVLYVIKIQTLAQGSGRCHSAPAV